MKKQTRAILGISALFIIMILAILYFTGTLQSILIPGTQDSLVCDYISGHDLSCTTPATNLEGIQDSPKYYFNVVSNMERGIFEKVAPLDNQNINSFFLAHPSVCLHSAGSDNYVFTSNGDTKEYKDSIIYVHPQDNPSSSTAKSCGNNYYRVYYNQLFIKLYTGSLIKVITSEGTFYGTCDFSNSNCMLDLSKLVELSNNPQYKDYYKNNVINITSIKITLGNNIPVPSAIVNLPINVINNNNTNPQTVVENVTVADNSVVVDNNDGTVTITSPGGASFEVSNNTTVITNNGDVIYTPRKSSNLLYIIIFLILIVFIIIAILISLAIRKK